MKPFVLELAMRSALLPLLLTPAFARAQAALVAPEPLVIEAAPYPEAARALGIGEASVVLRISIDASGAVTDAEVIEAAGHGFDEAARDALLRSRFKPAQRDGQPMPARILYRYPFIAPLPVPAPAISAPEPAPVEPPAQPAPPPAMSASSPPIQEVRVRGKLSDEQALEQSAEAVTVF